MAIKFIHAGFVSPKKDAIVEEILFYLSLKDGLKLYNIDTQLIITGSSPHNTENYLKHYLPNLKIDSANILILGYLSSEQINFQLASADVGIYFRTDSLQNNFNFPTKFISYFSFGLPVITNNVGIVNEIVNHGVDGFIIKDIQKDSSYVIESLVTSLNELKVNAKYSANRFLLKSYISSFKNLLFL